MLGDGFLHSSPEALALIPHAMAVKFGVLADGIVDDELHVFVADVSDDELLDRIRATSGLRVRPKAAPVDRIRSAIASAYAANSRPDLEYRNGDSPAVRAVDALHETAIRAGASDIHVEPTSEGGRARLRVDGMLRETQTFTGSLYAALVSRMKLLASMDISERRQPQDGRYSLEFAGRSFDARVSSMPTCSGEKLVIRLLDLQTHVPPLESLGMTPAMLVAYREAIHAANGFIVACGPTGSGKTTTLYASLAERNVESQHVCSVEDPVEVHLNGVAQVQVNARAGLTFASALRGFLRQDPNVIMLGEMRDAESASVALSAALSGQLVVTSLHAADALGAIERLMELGVSRQTLSVGLTAIVAQRLVRVLCTSCRRRASLGVRDAAMLGLRTGVTAFEPQGCGRCAHQGYRGRVGIFELLTVTDGVRQAIAQNEPAFALTRCAQANGYRPMVDMAANAVETGTTSSAEVRRVLGSSEGS